MSVQTVSRVETEINKGWMRKNPEIAVAHLLKFLGENSERNIRVTRNTNGFLTLTAV
jgi:hypothetical protein